MSKRMEVVAEARSWLGTPVVHQGHLKQVGTDCGGLVAGVAIRVGLVAADWWDTVFAPHAGYGRTPTNGTLAAICRRFMREIAIDRAQAADVLLLRFAVEPQHLAIVVPYEHGGLAMVHAYSRSGKVVEHRFAEVWRARVTAAFELPGIA